MVAEQSKYHVVLEDPNSSETLGLLLVEQGDTVGRIAQLANPYAAKAGGGTRELSDLTDLSVYGQTNWEGGRGQDRFEEEERYFDSFGCETRIEGQVTLSPAVTTAGLGTAPEYLPVWDWWKYVGQLDTRLRAAQSFTAPAGGLSCTGAVLKLIKAGVPASTYTIKLYSDSGGLPNTELKTHTVNLASLSITDAVEYKATWTAQALTGSARYHVALCASAWDGGFGVRWCGDSAAGYTGENGSQYISSWAAFDPDFSFWFKVNEGSVFSADFGAVSPVRFNGKWYCANGTTVYVWNTSTSIWETSESTTGTVTDLCVWGDFLWAARGTSTMRKMNTSDVWATATVARQYLAWYKGYLYGSDATNLEDIYYTSDGSTWSSAIDVGPGDWGVRGMCGFRDQLAVANDVGLWLHLGDWTYQVLDWLSQENSTNGQAMYSWARTGELFINVGYGLYRWTGSSMVSCGPDRGTGLPVARAGKVAALCGTVNWLFAAIDAGASGVSSVLAYNGSGWHEIARAAASGDRIRGLGYETISSPPRLWWTEGNITKYVELPDYSDNPYQYTSVTCTPDGNVELSTWGSELPNVVKEWRYVVLQAENCTSTRTIEVWYEVDRSGSWTYAGAANTAQLIHRIPLSGSSFTTKTLTSGCTTTTIELATGSTTTDMSVGEWVRINGYIRQIESITDSNTFVLEKPLPAAPSSGDSCYASAPAGAELRLKLRLTTQDSSQSPKLLHAAVFCDANVADRWNITLNVRCEDGMTCLDGSAYDMNAAALATALDGWITRKTAFYLHDIRGAQRTVKIANASEVQVQRRNTSTAAQRNYASVFRLGLIEVDVEDI